MDLGRLEQIKDLRSVWTDEARDFTPWLASDENIALLSEALGIDIEVVEVESSVGSFNVDIYAKDVDTGQKIIIENQLEDTNHDHLGKLITYASGKDASVLVWIVKHAREEHKSAVEWLNNHLDENIAVFLCEIKLYRIGDSPIAPQFDIVEQPNEWTKAGRQAQKTTGIEKLRLEYWSAFNEYIRSNDKYSSNLKCRKPSTDHWHSFAAGTSLCHYAAILNTQQTVNDIELCIFDNKDFYDFLYDRKDKIEEIAGIELKWFKLPNIKASKIKASRPASNFAPSSWEEQFEWMAETLLRFKNAFGGYIREYKNL